jgi:hypothetical protein
VIIVRERPAGGGSKRLENQERQRRRASPAGCEDRTLAARAGNGTEAKIEARAHRARFARACAWSAEKQVRRAKGKRCPSAGPGPFCSGSLALGFGGFRIWDRAADIHPRRLYKASAGLSGNTEGTGSDCEYRSVRKVVSKTVAACELRHRFAKNLVRTRLAGGGRRIRTLDSS